ncbi:AAA family ATPase [Roseibium alexandrii]|uniref:AAA family ATPase n=1 Tax=Roseibium alexandrii TaxID=388408 RepID=UPI003752F624
MPIRFEVIANAARIPNQGRSIGYLWTDKWNDYWDYRTLYSLVIFDDDGEKHDIGGVKIGQFNWNEEQSRPEIPNEFDTLDERFFSLGQDVDYYTALREIGADVAQDILEALRDVAADEALFARAKNESVMGVSLMRSVSERSIVGQFRRVIRGEARLTSYQFTYRGPAQLNNKFDPIELAFAVEPDSKPPTNIQVVIGRNGVGKSFLLNSMSRALVYLGESEEENGAFHDDQDIFEEEFESPFANIVSVTFSAFDDFPVIREKRNALKGTRYTNIGLRKLEKETDKDGNTSWFTVTQDPKDLASDFIDSAKLCAFGERSQRWFRALRALESDPIFEEAEIVGLRNFEGSRFSREAGRLFRRLSSGHKIVLLTITKLVEKVEERTLVVMDEPEAHLHPPLLSALIRAISDLMINRNGVAIIATHSPVILQEVPRSCVWKIRRYGGGAVAERPRIETFAEDVGQLTHEVFGLEVMRSGFNKMISDAFEEADDFEDVAEKFGQEIGSEGRALISSLIALRDAENNDEAE